MFFEFLNFILGKIIFFCGAITGDCFPKPLSPEMEKECLERWRKYKDKSAKDTLIRHNLRLVAHVVKKYQGADDNDDLISTGTIGLIKAINTYNPEKGAGLATYTARCIENEILMLLRSNKKHLNQVSLFDSVGTDKDGNELTLIDLIPNDGDPLADKVEKKMRDKKFAKFVKECLTDREYTVVRLRYGLEGAIPLPQREVARLLKISRSYISRIEKKALEKIKSEMKLKSADFY